MVLFMKANDIRSKFLEFFENQGHTLVESAPIVPQNDPSLLFTPAGMVPFKDVFLGKEKRAYTRATSSQKCVRAGGKHNDLESVGFTARHHTFFEMLGNFSFGDYFKEEAIHLAWKFVTEELKLPKDRLYVSVFETDDEAAAIWHQKEGVPLDRIKRFGEKDNFWAMGETGPCGPCSEIFIDRGEKYSKGPNTPFDEDGDRYLEFWNLVFMQYNRDEKGTLHPLPKPSVDTGAGLERIAAILQDADTNYETDLFLDIIHQTAQLGGIQYDPKHELAVSFRVIADHARAATFLIGDGVFPSNEGRGYVLRRIMRRAIRHGKKIGFEAPFLNQVTGFVIQKMGSAYPDLLDKKDFIQKAVQAEEEQFLRTLDRGLTLLDEEMAKVGQSKSLPGEVAFKLYDTYGFPVDLTRVIALENGIEVDEEGFKRSMERQRAESRKHWKGSGDEATQVEYHQLLEELREKNKTPEFTGYENLSELSECLAIFLPEGTAKNEEKSLSRIDFFKTPESKPPVIQAVFAKTPFYGESGGQTGDQGQITSEDGFEGEVIDAQKPIGDLIVAHILPKKGSLKVGSLYHQETHAALRAKTARNHTATHLLHWALREVLGKHVKQAGSLVNADLLRFDFTHFQPVSSEELRTIEDLINEKIWRADPVAKKIMKKEEATQSGAIAFFGEKYGDEVRVVSVGDFSVELCGGSHVDNASEIHLFKIMSEAGIAAGVRRIIAYTSEHAFESLRTREDTLSRAQEMLKASSLEDVPYRVEKLLESERTLKKELEKFQAQKTGSEAEELLKDAKQINGVSLIASICQPDDTGIQKMREIADRLKQKSPDSLVALGMKSLDGSKAFLLVSKGPSVSSKIHAGKIIQEIAPLIDGRGGGKPDLAQAGGGKPDGLTIALKKIEEMIS
jgi:alanyl-tRNA synthetase